MLNIIKTIGSSPLGIALTLLPLAIIAKNLIGAGGSILDTTWNANYLKRGLFKGSLIYAGIGVLALMAHLSPELSVGIGGSEYTLVEGVVVLIMGAIILYIKDVFELLAIIFKQSTTEDE